MKRNTIQRALVFEAVNRLRCHASADDVYSLVSSEHKTISRGTVYRNLNSLAEDGEILKIDVPGAAERFDHRTDEHYHVKCARCGAVSDVDMLSIGDITSKITNTHGYNINGYEILFTGICNKCREPLNMDSEHD